MDWRTRKTHELLGQTVTVVVDRPIGYRHGDILYPINYGYVPGIMAGDGEEQDAYILGISEKLDTFTGSVVGVIRRRNDCEDKLVVAPEGQLYHQAQIAEAVHFQEQYFVSTIDCLLRKSCGVIPYRTAENGPEFLILLQTNDCWSFPKGHMEPGETEQQTALRELYEETALRAELIPGISATSEYPVGPTTKKQVTLFLGKVSGEPHGQPGEVQACRWVAGSELHRYLQPDTALAVEPLLKKVFTDTNVL